MVLLHSKQSGSFILSNKFSLGLVCEWRTQAGVSQLHGTAAWDQLGRPWLPAPSLGARAHAHNPGAAAWPRWQVGAQLGAALLSSGHGNADVGGSPAPARPGPGPGPDLPDWCTVASGAVCRPRPGDTQGQEVPGERGNEVTTWTGW